jgi:hypothetical protein
MTGRLGSITLLKIKIHGKNKLYKDSGFSLKVGAGAVFSITIIW